ncbi:hypothetical protein WI29_30230 [Burkholderia ubonensis]|nr:hypothetical protein WI31_24070 [Burkholderia ubonensis]KUZ12127.1 hypothetical protein WI29_30230 [Burkholderia ubonensis]KUZ35443.1 hypothetical protein WI30_09905 [Burkholderia ubonensis]KUZ38967.1 hypothetical protein WI32_09940 [Burkholderia ubonensis]KUZ45430.1 hypothetical protein WI33_25670 [Burkholderia ubonensis]
MADGWPERVLSDATRGTAEQLRLTTRDEVVAMNVLTDDGNRKSREHPVDLGAAPSREGDAPGNGVRIVDTNPAGATTW